MTEKWQIQWQAAWINGPTDNSAMTRACVEQWIQVLDDQEHAPDASLDRSGRTAETPAHTACDLWDIYTDRALFLATTSDHRAFTIQCYLRQNLSSRVASHSAPFAATSRSTTWLWHKGWTHNDAWNAGPSQVAPSPTPWPQSASIDELQVHDPWRTPRNQKEQPHHSW